MSLLEKIDEEETSERLRAQLRTLQNQLAKLRHTKAEQMEAIYRAMRDGMALAGPAKPIKPPLLENRGKADGKPERAVLITSDWQLGKKTADYDTAKCEQRLHMYMDKVEKIVRIHRSDHPVNDANLFWLGDHVEGELIFPGQASQIDSSMTRQIVSTTRIGRDIERRALGFYQHVYNNCRPGNHGLLGGHERYNYNPETNNDRLIMKMLEMFFENEPRSEWDIPFEPNKKSSLGVSDVLGWKFLLFHGNQIRGALGLPWYGFYKKILGWVVAFTMAQKKDGLAFDYFACGHWHTPTTMSFNGIRGWVNGTIESDNEYALEELAAAGTPAQWLLFVHPDNGVTAEYLIDLKD